MLALITAVPAILKGLLGFGETIKSVSGDIARLQIAKLEASTNERKLEIDGEIRALEARRDLMMKESEGSRVNQLFRVAISIPAAVLLYKIEVWDRTLGLGTTPKLSTEEWAYIGMVCGFYLLNRTIQVARR